MLCNKFLIATSLLSISAVFLDAAETTQAYAETNQAASASVSDSNDTELISKPVIVPIVSSDPKIATSGGLMVAYAHKFDQESPTTLFGAVGAYTTTDSYYYGVFLDSYFSQDRHRIKAAAVHGVVKNDYEDFLGTGLQAQTTDDAYLVGARYLGKINGPWYLGAQGVALNYLISGDNTLSQGMLDLAGLTGLDATGLGIAGAYDTKDNQNSPRKGMAAEINNFWFRESLGGDVDFESLNAEYQIFLPHALESTTAIQIKGRWTNDAPPSGYSSVDLRGYVKGQYLAENMTLIEVDERMALIDKFGLAVFAGIAYLYGDGADDNESENVYPNIGLGAYYQLNEDKMVVRADIAFGTEGNRGFYLSFNQPF